MKKAWIVLTVAFWAVQLSAQNCEYFSKGNDMVQDKPCAPVEASWEITYGGLTYTGPNVHQLHPNPASHRLGYRRRKRRGNVHHPGSLPHLSGQRRHRDLHRRQSVELRAPH